MTEQIEHTAKRKPQLKTQHWQAAVTQGPKTAEGDPCFTTMDELAQYFDQEDVFAMINESLYQRGYQLQYHRKKNAELRELRAELKKRKQQQLLAAPARVKEAVATVVTRRPLQLEELSTRELLDMTQDLAEVAETDPDLLTRLNEALGGALDDE